MFRMCRRFLLGALFAGTMSSATIAQAGIFVSAVDVEIVEDPILISILQVFITPGTEVRNGDYFTMYDTWTFTDEIGPEHEEPTNWGVSLFDNGMDPPSQYYVGITPVGTDPLDNDAIHNVTWIYTGLTPIQNPGVEDLFIGTFIARTFIPDDLYTGPPTEFYFTEQSHVIGRGPAGSSEFVVRTTLISAVPEPATWLACLVAVPFVALGRSRRRAHVA